MFRWRCVFFMSCQDVVYQKNSVLLVINWVKICHGDVYHAEFISELLLSEVHEFYGKRCGVGVLVGAFN